MLLKIIIIVLVILLCYSIIPTNIYKLKYKINKRKKDKIKNHHEKELYLTFDDGPDEKYTPLILDLLKRYNVKATFFVVADFAKNNQDIIKRMQEEGHCIGLHSYEHENALFKSKSYTKYDFEESVKTMNELGIDVKYYRPPWGHCNIFTNYEMRRHKLIKVMWDVMAEDWQGDTTAETISDKLLRRSENGSIICLHDGRGKNEAPSRTLQALAKAIPIWLENEYKFLTVEDYYE